MPEIELPEEWPSCPVCFRPASEVSIGVLTRHRVGHFTPTTEASPAGPRFRCVEGHWFDRGGRLSGPPPDVTIVEGG